MMKHLALFLLLSACADAPGKLVLTFVDEDGDGWGSEAMLVSMVPSKGPFANKGGDCADQDPDRHPGAEEACDQLDNDCNGSIDDGVGERWYPDLDGDGQGSGEPLQSCEPVSGRSERPDDCDDRDPLTFAGAAEVCDGADNDCDELTPADEDVCPGDWYSFGDSVYLVFLAEGDVSYTYEELFPVCAALGYHAVFLESQAEADAVLPWIADASMGGAWLGATFGPWAMSLDARLRAPCEERTWSWYDPTKSGSDACTPLTGFASEQGLFGVRALAAVLESGTGAWLSVGTISTDRYAIVCEAEIR